MNTRLCSINLSIKDYESKEEGKVEYHGEVVSIDEDLKHYMFRFFNTDSGTLAVSIDASKDVIKVIEHSEGVKLIMGIKEGTYQDCVYEIDSSRLELETRTFEVNIEDNYISFDYDLFAKSDVNHDKAMTRNIVRIDFEGEKKVC